LWTERHLCGPKWCAVGYFRWEASTIRATSLQELQSWRVTPVHTQPSRAHFCVCALPAILLHASQ
jgi:hypothetical protein